MVGRADEGSLARLKAEFGRELRRLREAAGMTQKALGRRVSYHRVSVTQVESGRQNFSRQFVEQVEAALDAQGKLFAIYEQIEAARGRQLRSAGPLHHGSLPAGKVEDVDQAVAASQQEWRSVRRHLNGHRAELARVAAELYPPELRLEGTPLLVRPEWIPAQPVDLADIKLGWVEGRQPQSVDGTEPEAARVLPLRTADYRYDRYTSAVRYLDSPTLFENRPSYRLLDVDWSDDMGRMSFGLAAYFDKLDVSEALGHELAEAQLRLTEKDGRVREVGWKRVPFRRIIGDSFDMEHLPVIPAVTTLTLCRDRAAGTAAFLLHWRNPEFVATAGGVYDVIPAGEFQPSSVAPWDQVNDFDLWRNIVREFSEELLGTPEHDGSRSTPIDYDSWPFYRSLERARATGQLGAFCLGVGLDALTLAATILTVVVIDDDVFEKVFGEIVRANAEGITVTTLDGQRSASGIPFTEYNVRRLLTSEPMASPGAACIALAWRHREALLRA